MRRQAYPREADGGRWPDVSQRDAAAIRLALCRHLLDQIGEDRPARRTAGLGEIGLYLSRWSEDGACRDPVGFCADTARLLGLVLSHLEQDSCLPAELCPTAPLAIG